MRQQLIKETAREPGSLSRISRILVCMSTLLATGLFLLAVRSFWRGDEAAWCTWKAKAGTKGVDRRIVIGSNHGGIFLLSTEADVPYNVDWYGGKPTEVIFRSTPEARIANSAIHAAGASDFKPRPRWLWGGFNAHAQANKTPGSEWMLEAVVVPIWVPFLVLLWPPLVVLRRWRILRHRRKNGLCLYCGYDLRASGPICSECGLPRAEPRGQRGAELRLVVRPSKPPVSRSVVLTACASIGAASLGLTWLVVYLGRPGLAVRLTPDTALSADHLPRRVELDLGHDIMLPLALIPAGHFTMGSAANEVWQMCSDQTQHEVTISRPFYMGLTTVTYEQYNAVMGDNPGQVKGARNFIKIVSWDEARAFCAEVSKRTGRTVHLPTEAQWEYACRAGTTTAFNTGAVLARDMANYGTYCTYPSNRAGDTERRFLLVGSFSPNAWGLYDMHGSLWQWCSDWYGDYDKGSVTDPTGPPTGSKRVVRGGCLDVPAGACRSGYRVGLNPDDSDFIGFRVVMAPVGVDLH